MSSLRTKALISGDLQTNNNTHNDEGERKRKVCSCSLFSSPKAPLDDDDDFFVFEGFFCRLLFNQKRV